MLSVEFFLSANLYVPIYLYFSYFILYIKLIFFPNIGISNGFTFFVLLNDFIGLDMKLALILFFS